MPLAHWVLVASHSGKSLFPPKLLWPLLFFFDGNGQDTLLWQPQISDRISPSGV